MHINMTKEEFIKNIKENKHISDLDEVIEHRLPVVQYFITNYSNAQIFTPNGAVHSRMITIEYDKETDFTLVNYAYNCIVELYKDGKIQ